MRWWARDRKQALLSRDTHRSQSERGNLDRALALIEEGELSKTARLLTSSSLGDLSDPRIIAQLEAKHPRRETAIDLERLEPLRANRGHRRRPHADLPGSAAALGHGVSKASRHTQRVPP